MRIDRDAAAVVGDGQKAVGAQFDLDERGMPGQRLVHGVVDDFGEQMMQRLFVGAADIHAGAAAYRLEPFEHLDIGRGIAGLGAGRARRGLGAARGPSVPAPNRSLADLVFAADFNGLDMALYVLRAAWRSELVALTMPRMGLKSDGWADGIRLAGPVQEQGPLSD